MLEYEAVEGRQSIVGMAEVVKAGRSRECMMMAQRGLAHKRVGDNNNNKILEQKGGRWQAM